MTVKRNILFIMNPISGTGKKTDIPRMIEETLDREKFYYTVKETEYAGHAAKMAREAKDNDTDIVVAIGGDGTVNEVARSIVNSQTALGIIPCGSGNGLARHLMLPMDYKKSIDVINRCKIHELDYGTINDMPFFCTCGMGFDAYISKKFAEAGKRGVITYIENVLKEGIKYKPETYVIESEEGTSSHKAFLVSCANASQYGNNAYIAPQASMSDGLLDVIIMEPFDIIEAPQVILELMNKTLDKSSKIKTFRTRSLVVHRESPGYIHCDGEPLTTGADIKIDLIKKGIKIIVNPNADKAKRRPNAIQASISDFFNDINSVREDISKQGRHIQELHKMILRKLNDM